MNQPVIESWQVVEAAIDASKKKNHTWESLNVGSISCRICLKRQTGQNGTLGRLKTSFYSWTPPRFVVCRAVGTRGRGR